MPSLAGPGLGDARPCGRADARVGQGFEPCIGPLLQLGQIGLGLPAGSSAKPLVRRRRRPAVAPLLQCRPACKSPRSPKGGSQCLRLDQRFRGPARALVVICQRVLADVVKLALSHGHYITRVADTARAGFGGADRLAAPSPRRRHRHCGERHPGTARRGRDAARRPPARHRADATRRPQVQAGGVRARR